MKRPTPLDEYIEKKKAEKAAAVKAYEDADQLVERLMIEIAALEQARGAIDAAKPQRGKPHAGYLIDLSPPETKRGRSISEQWKKVLFHISQKPDGASIDQIYAFCKTEGIELKRPTLRAQMSNYVNKHGYLASTFRGRFEITPKGREIAETVKV